MAETPRYLVCGCTPWARRIFDTTISKFPGQWVYIETPKELCFALPTTINLPEYIFFLHWRWKVPETIIRRHWCIGFHLGKLPQQAGGSPLQWRILAGETEAILTEFQMTEELDAGLLYGESLVPLHGTAEAIYARTMKIAANMILQHINNPVVLPMPLSGERKVYPRRTPEQSLLLEPLSLHVVYDYIRMLDAEGYPQAYLDYGGLRFMFRHAVEYSGRIEADVVIREIPA